MRCWKLYELQWQEVIGYHTKPPTTWYVTLFQISNKFHGWMSKLTDLINIHTRTWLLNAFLINIFRHRFFIISLFHIFQKKKKNHDAWCMHRISNVMNVFIRSVYFKIVKEMKLQYFPQLEQRNHSYGTFICQFVTSSSQLWNSSRRFKMKMYVSIVYRRSAVVTLYGINEKGNEQKKKHTKNCFRILHIR